MRMLNILVAASLGLAACSESEPERQDAPFADAAVTVDGGVIPSLRFRCTVVDGLESNALLGDNAVLALDANGEPTIAYGAVPNGSTEREIRYAVRVNGEWTSEQAAVPGGDLVGLGFAHVNGVPHIAYIGGDDDGVATTPYPTDLMLSTRTGGQWSERTLVDVSNEAPATCPGVQNYCNRGHVVGTHAAIAASPRGFVVGYRDTHFNFASDDFALSDVEMFGSGIQPALSVVDPVRSGGAFLGIALTADDRPVLAYNVESEDVGEARVGVWAAVWRGTEWVLARLGTSQTTARTSVAAASDGTLYVAYFDATNDDLVLATSIDDGTSWTSEVVESIGKVGLHPALTLDASDQPVLAYTYCGPVSDSECPGTLGSNAEVRLARRDGNGWDTILVDDGQGQGGVGTFNSVAIAPNGTIYVAFQDTRNNDLIIAEAQP